VSRYLIIAGLSLIFLIAGCGKDAGTESNNLPYAPSSPSPPNGATDQPTDVDLSWTGGDPDGDPVTYDLYLGTKSSPPLVASGLVQTSYDPGPLNYDTEYYWRIVSKDNQGGETNGPVWTFRTEGGTGYRNLAQIESVYVSSGSHVEVRAFFENNQELAALTVPLQYSSTAVVCESVSFAGSRIDYLGTKGGTIDSANRRVLIYGIVFSESYLPTGSGLLCTIHFTIPSPTNTVVAIDSTAFPPSARLEFVNSSATSISPRFVPGKIVINTQ
jgi:hypothetical protein